MKRFFLLVVLVLMTGGISVSQQLNVDSLFRIWNDGTSSDSSRLKAMQVLAWRAVFERPDSGMALAEKQLELARSAGDLRAEYEAYTTLAVGSSMRGEQVAALAYFEECADIADALDDDKRKANTLSNLGNVYRHMGDLPLALDHQQRSLGIYEGLADSVNMAGSLNNIGTIFTELNEPEKALENYERSAALYRGRNDQRGLAQSTLNLGATHRALGERELALKEFMESLTLYSALGRRTETGIVYNNLGQTYTELERIPEALEALANAEVIFRDIQAHRYLGRTHYYRGLAYLQQGRNADARRECSAGAVLADQLGNLVLQRECAECLMQVYSESGDFRRAFEQQQRFLAIDDSLDRSNNAKEVALLDQRRRFQQRQIEDSLARAEERFHRELAYAEDISRERLRRNVFLFSGIGVLLLAGGLWSRLRYTRRSRAIIQREKDRSEELLHNILPEAVAKELKAYGRAEARQFETATVLFTDFKGFTSIAEQLSAADLVAEIDTCFKAFDGIVEHYRIEKIKTIGDAYMAAAGLPDPTASTAADAVLAALDMQEFMQEHAARRKREGLPVFEMRVGLHTGPVVAGIVGVRKFQYDIWGDTVNIAARMESSGAVGEVNVSASTYAAASASPELRFIHRGMVEAKGKGEMDMYFAHRSDR